MDANAKQEVEAYLDLLDAGKTPRMSAQSDIEQGLADVQAKLAGAQGVRKLELLQERENLAQAQADLASFSAAEDKFVESIAEYAEANGVSYSTLREFGIAKDLLDRAGVRRTRRSVPIDRKQRVARTK